MDTVKLVEVVIFASDNGRDGWEPVHQKDIPTWVLDPDTLGRMLGGEECLDCAEGMNGSKWFRAIRSGDMLAMLPGPIQVH